MLDLTVIDDGQMDRQVTGNRWTPSPMDTRNRRRVTRPLLASWVGIGYLMEEEWVIREKDGVMGERVK
ncbi:hypothetical protein EVAR_69234_1 [Eumeta japonica]|uniref:Uncharacterized protein n=1 Tax=Eumeta variegata TaxID=151549 RepID=A0A4C2A631_EUMVA|nr:hypothetical protein EVAR_69234_1 [Eumeta japonica]